MLSGKHPFYQLGDKAREMYDKVGTKRVSFDIPEFKGVSQDAKDFIERCLIKDYKARKGADYLL